MLTGTVGMGHAHIDMLPVLGVESQLGFLQLSWWLKKNLNRLFFVFTPKFIEEGKKTKRKTLVFCVPVTPVLQCHSLGSQTCGEGNLFLVFLSCFELP